MARMKAWAVALGLAGALVLASSAAHALKQPNNVTIPVGSGLQNLFVMRGEGIDSLKDAQDVPETFTPTCKLQFEVLQRNAGYKNSFGWYNVTGKKPTAAELYEFIGCNDPVGVKKLLSIKKDPNYLGGDIGFFEATGPCGSVNNNYAIFFSEKKWNPDGNQLNPFIHLIIYNSTVTPKAFYFGWEDLLSGGDNDFDDLTTFVSGIGCTGSGGECSTGKLGVCAKGSLQCQSGQLACMPLSGPSIEACDGFDNDCNGVVDEGNLCPEKEVCDKGTCVPNCDGGEFTCPKGKVCDPKGLCVDPACLEITCPENTKCEAGQCVGPCDGVVCPYDQMCLAGTCFDPCTKFTCDDEQVCVKGACVEKCDCAGCPKGKSCQPDGRCIPDACLNKVCDAGTHCDELGNCVDDCLGASCPKGQICKLGDCIPDPDQGGAGGAGGSSMTGELVGGGAPDTSSASGQGGDGGSNAFGGFQVKSTGACGCRIAEPATGLRASWLALGVGLLWWRRRRT